MQQTYRPTRNEEEIHRDYNPIIVNNILEEIQRSPTRIRGPERHYRMGDCGSCPQCACMDAEVQFLAVIEAPATVALMIAVGAIKFSS